MNTRQVIQRNLCKGLLLNGKPRSFISMNRFKPPFLRVTENFTKGSEMRDQFMFMGKRDWDMNGL